MLFRLIAIIAFAFTLAGCPDSSSAERAEERRDLANYQAHVESRNPYVDPKALSVFRGSPLGNFTIVNNSRETLIVGTHAMFEKSGSYIKIVGASATVDIRGLGTDRDLVRLYAITETNLLALRAQAGDDGIGIEKGAVSESPLYIPTEGGTWNPFGWASGDENTKYGTVTVCNYQDRIVGITVGNPHNELEGLINRGACNVPLKLPANGLVTLFAIDIETSEVLREETIGLVEGGIAELVIGAYDYPDAPALVRLVNHSNVHVNIFDRITQKPAYNEACNFCNTVIAGSVGELNIESSLEIQFDALPTDGGAIVTSEIFVAARGETVQLVLDRNEEGLLQLRRVTAQECLNEQPDNSSDPYYGYYENYYGDYNYYDDYGYPGECFSS